MSKYYNPGPNGSLQRERLEEPSLGRVQAWTQQACRAPSADNMQPWTLTYRISENHVALCLELDKKTQRYPSEIDPNYSTSYIALGALARNFSLLAAADGFCVSEVKTHRIGEDLVQFELVIERSNTQTSPLMPWIVKRKTSRLPYQTQPLSREHVESLTQMAGLARSSQLIYREVKESHLIIKALETLDGLRYNNKRLFFDFVSKLRFGKETAKTKNGLAGPVLGIPLGARLGLWILQKISFSWRFNFLGLQQLSTYLGVSRLFKASAGTLCLLGESDRPEGWFQLGFDLQQVWLYLNSSGISVQPYGTTLLLYRARLEQQNHLKNLSPMFDERSRKSLLEISDELKKQTGLDCSRPAIVLRIGYARRGKDKIEASWRQPLELIEFADFVKLATTLKSPKDF